MVFWVYAAHARHTSSTSSEVLTFTNTAIVGSERPRGEVTIPGMTGAFSRFSMSTRSPLTQQEARAVRSSPALRPHAPYEHVNLTGMPSSDRSRIYDRHPPKLFPRWPRMSPGLLDGAAPAQQATPPEAAPPDRALIVQTDQAIGRHLLPSSFVYVALEQPSDHRSICCATCASFSVDFVDVVQCVVFGGSRSGKAAFAAAPGLVGALDFRGVFGPDPFGDGAG